MRLNEITVGDALNQEVVRLMMEESPILRFAEFYPMVGNADTKRKQSAASGGRFRALDEVFPDNRVTPIWVTPSLKIFGDKVETDRAHERRGQDIDSVRASDLVRFARTLGKEWQNFFVNGDSAVDVKAFDGVKTRIQPAHKVSVPAAGLAVEMGNSNTAKTVQQQWMELLEQLISLVDGGPNLLLMDGLTRSRLTTIAREFIRWEKDAFGTPIAYYNEIPIVLGGFDKAGNRVIPHNETVGASTDCTSIYALRFGEESDLSIATNVGVEVKDMGLVGSHYTYAVELDMDMALLQDKAIAVLPGIRLIPAA